MNEPLEPMPVPPEPAPTRVGALLRAARESQNLTIGQLAETLKVSTFKLEALEADRLDLLSDPVFARALVASVCRSLKMDAQPVLARLPRPTPTPIRTDDQGLNATYRESGGGLGRGWFAQDRKTIGIAVLLVLTAALAIVLWPKESADPVTPALAPVPEQHLIETPTVDAPAGTASDSAQLPSPATAPEAPAGPATEAATPVATPEASPLLTLRASGTSWVQVKDAKGVVQLHKTVQAGEVLSVAGELPLSVVLGRADAVAVSVRNQRLDLRDVSQNNVARFEVK